MMLAARPPVHRTADDGASVQGTRNTGHTLTDRPTYTHTGRLRAALQADQGDQDPGGVPGPLWARLSAEAREQLQRLIGWLAREEPELYGLFADDQELSVAI